METTNLAPVLWFIAWLLTCLVFWPAAAIWAIGWFLTKWNAKPFDPPRR